MRFSLATHLKLVLVLAVTFAASAYAGAPALLTRQQAVDALLDPGSGVTLDLTESAVWSPFVDFGFGSGFEGLLPTGWAVEPALINSPAERMNVSTVAYFFWIDDEPVAEFVHPTRFVLLDASNSSPTVANGGIVVVSQGWWPVIIEPGIETEYFDTLDSRVTPNPPGFDNPEGLVAGPASDPSDIVVLTPPPAPIQGGGQATASNNACGLIINGHSGPHFANNVTRFMSDLTGHFGVDPNRVVKANDGDPAEKQDICDAIDAITGKNPPCDKIYIRMASHGESGRFTLSAEDRPNNFITAEDLCKKFKKLAALGVPICLLINACESSSLIDANRWNFPAGSSIITSAKDGNSSWGHATKFTQDGTDVTESLYVHAHSQCLNDKTDSDKDGKVDADTDKDGKVDDCEAHEWVKKTKPCYNWTGNNKDYKPSGVSGDGKPDPEPQKVTVGRDPEEININVCNATGDPKTDFHMIFKGDVRGGLQRAWQSDQNDNFSFSNRWARGENGRIITYDAEKDETMVCWIDKENPVQPNAYVHFGYFAAPGDKLKPLRQYWTPTSSPPADGDKTPSKETKLKECRECGTDDKPGVVIRLMTLDPNDGGDGETVNTASEYCISPEAVPLDNLSFPSTQGLGCFPLYNGPLIPNNPQEIILTIPDDAPAGHVIIVRSVDNWGLNSNIATPIVAFDRLAPQGTCQDCDGQAAGDATGDGLNNLFDASELAKGWLTGPPEACCADYNRDNSIDVSDLVIQAQNWTRDDLGLCEFAGICGPVCGDGNCEIHFGETCETCDFDCGACVDVCGDGVCSPPEFCESCPEDCGSCPATCGDGFCEPLGPALETCETCSDDCGFCSDVVIPAGEDCWSTSCGRTKFSFCDEPLPANFFDPGSEPFVGEVKLGGIDPDSIDTRVSRLQDMVLPDDAGVATTPIQIIQLDLVSCEPISVLTNGQSGLWDVRLNLSDFVPQGPGNLTATKTHCNGGTYESNLPVRPRFIFTKVGDPGQIRILDTGEVGSPPIQFGTTQPTPWVHELDPTLNNATSCGVSFHPGVEDPVCDPLSFDQSCVQTTMAGRNLTLDWRVPGCPLNNSGACLDNLGTCTEGPASGCAATYMGDGTNCADGDNDNAPDIGETNDCCGSAAPGTIGTDPKNPDTDGDGILDGNDLNPCIHDGGGQCNNGVLDGLETDVDCGGPDCQSCPDGANCFGNGDCLSQNCIDGVCFPPATGFCGDLQCNGQVENCHNCSQDCGSCGTGDCCTETPGQASCSDQVITECVCALDPFCCETEWDDICVGEANDDCGAGCPGGNPCGNGTCEPGEDEFSCPSDCSINGVCGDEVCNVLTEDPASCNIDCFCTDGVCSPGFEDPGNCPQDCQGGPPV